MMKISKKNILEYAKRYDADYKPEDKLVGEEMKRLLKKQKYLRREDLIKIVGWKTRNRSVHYCKENDSNKIRELTKRSFCVGDEKARIESLLGQKGGLRGVGYPVASTILHFAFPNRYPIMDFRVIRSLCGKEPSTYTYNFGFWNEYCNRIRTIQKKLNLPIRMVEKALWKYDELKFGKRKTCRQKE